MLLLLARRRPTAGLRLARAASLAVACGLGLGAFAILRSIAPSAAPGVVAIAAGFPFACGVALAFTLDKAAAPQFAWIGGGWAAAALAAAVLVREPAQLTLLFGFSSLGLLLVGGYRLFAARRRSRPLTRPAAFALAALAVAIGGYCVYYIAASRDLMFGDFMYRRVEAIIVASMLDKGQIANLIALFVNSIKDEYSLAPVLAPGAVLAATSPSSRGWYEGAIVVLYAAPACLALAVLARELARRAGARRRTALSGAGAMLLAGAAAFAAYPTGIAVVARGMPDIGGLVLVVAALLLSDRLARALALPPGHDAAVGRLTRRITFALALCLFGMFLFRRWYAFAAVGVTATLALEIALLAVSRGARFRWREAIAAGALAALSLLALGAPVLIDWLPNPAAHDYVTIYAAYRKAPAVVIAEGLGGDGAGVLAAAAACAILLAFRSADGRLLRLTTGASLLAVAMFLRVQSPAVHHAYLLTPLVAATIAAALLLAFERSRLAATVAVAALAAFTLTPAGALAPKGLAPTAALAPPPRADLAELSRLKAFIDANARPDRRYCVLASSYTVSDAVVAELWQLDPGGSPLVQGAVSKTGVGMAHVDTRDGPPVAAIKDCAIMLVGDPVQTHLLRAYQQTIIVPANEMLSGAGIGESYRRTGEVFHLQNGVTLIAFERIRPLEDADIAALQARWRAAREAYASPLRGAPAD